MKKEYLPYYASRLFLSTAFAIWMMGVHWHALLVATFFFCMFLLYLHSGWFQIDLTSPLSPLRRDIRGKLAQRKALIASLGVSFIIFWVSSLLSTYFSMTMGTLLVVAILVYFAAQFIFFMP